MNTLPWFTAKPIQVGDVYPLADVGSHQRSVKVTDTVKFDWPKWVRFEVTFFKNDGTLGNYKDYTGETGSGFVNCWGPSLIRTRWELLKYRAINWFWGQRKDLANRIYPRN